MMISFFFWRGECRAAFVEHLGTRAIVLRRTLWTRNSKNDRITEKWSPKCLHQKISRSVKGCPCPSKLTKSDGKKWWKSSVKNDLLSNIRSSVREYVSLNKKLKWLRYAKWTSSLTARCSDRCKIWKPKTIDYFIYK